MKKLYSIFWFSLFRKILLSWGSRIVCGVSIRHTTTGHDRDKGQNIYIYIYFSVPGTFSRILDFVPVRDILDKHRVCPSEGQGHFIDFVPLIFARLDFHQPNNSRFLLGCAGQFFQIFPGIPLSLLLLLCLLYCTRRKLTSRACSRCFFVSSGDCFLVKLLFQGDCFAICFRCF